MRLPFSIRFDFLIVFLVMLCVGMFAGCAHDVKPSGPQQTVFLAGADVGAVLIAADQYQALNDCSAAGHTLPCSTQSNNTKIQKAKVDLLTARNKARDLVRTPGFDQSSLGTLEAEMQAAIDIINAIVTPAAPSAFVPSWLGGAMVTASTAAIVPLTGAQLYLSLLLQILGWAKQIFGAGSKIHTFTSAIEDQVRAMQAENNRNPTDAEWASQDDQLNQLVQQPPQAQPGQG